MPRLVFKPVASKLAVTARPQRPEVPSAHAERGEVEVVLDGEAWEHARRLERACEAEPRPPRRRQVRDVAPEQLDDARGGNDRAGGASYPIRIRKFFKFKRLSR